MGELRVDQTDWFVNGRTLQKQYRYQGLGGPDTVHIFQIDVQTSRSILGHAEPHIFFFLKPSPWPDLDEGFLVAQLALRRKLIHGPFATVLVSNADDGSMLLSPAERDGAAGFVDVLYGGEDMRLLLLNDAEKLLELPIPNDRQFLDAAEAFFEAAH